MNITDIKQGFKLYLKNHKKTSQWLWFVFLWCSGLAVAMALAYPIKLLIRMTLI